MWSSPICCTCRMSGRLKSSCHCTSAVRRSWSSRSRLPGTRKRDETIKRALYERTGVTEYWIVDPLIDAVRVYRRSGDRFARVVELSAEAGDVQTTALLPGLELPLGRLFAR